MGNLISKYQKEIDSFLEKSIENSFSFSESPVKDIFLESGRIFKENERQSVKLSDIIGQTNVKDLLYVGIESCKDSNRTLDHVLLFGPPGNGKSMIANAIANELSAEIIQFFGTELKDKSTFEDLIDCLKTFSRQKKVIFVDEIHNIPVKSGELLYQAMQDFVIDDTRIDKFTLIGATTNPGKLQRPFRDRFTYNIKLDQYSIDDIKEIVLRKFPKFSPDLAAFVASRSKLIPRIAIHFSTIIESAAIYDNSTPSVSHGFFVMNLLKVDSLGLNENDRNVLKLLYRSSGHTLGKNTIIASLDIDESDYNFMIEPILLRMGLLSIIPKGRTLTSSGKSLAKSYSTK